MSLPATYDPVATRERLVGAAFQEIWKNGYRASSMDAILQAAGVTKGALYHHFDGKLQLGYAVLDEVVHGWIRQHWIEPLKDCTDPVEDLKKILSNMGECMDEDTMRNGCPLNNLAQEMSPVDEGFRERIQAIYGEWRQSIVAAIQRAQAGGMVRGDADPEQVAFFIISVIQGGAGLLKNTLNVNNQQALREGLAAYLDTLRPVEGKQA